MKVKIKRNAILMFFCIMLGGIIMADCLIAANYTKMERGIVNTFSSNTVEFFVQQAESENSFLNGEFAAFMDQQSSGIVAKPNTSVGGVELYSAPTDFDGEKYGCWLREDVRKNHPGEQFYYKGNSYKVLGSYTEKETNERFVIDMRGELEQQPREAMNGSYYLDCKEKSLEVFYQLQSAITQKNPTALVQLLESSAKGNLILRVVKNGDSMYYLGQLGLIAVLNLLNFGNIASSWVAERRNEIYIRKLHGGRNRRIIWRLILSFLTVSAASLLIGMLAGGLVAGVNVHISGDGLLLGFGMNVLQWLVLATFGWIVLSRCVCRSIQQLKKGERSV